MLISVSEMIRSIPLADQIDLSRFYHRWRLSSCFKCDVYLGCNWPGSVLIDHRNVHPIYIGFIVWRIRIPDFRTLVVPI